MKPWHWLTQWFTPEADPEPHSRVTRRASPEERLDVLIMSALADNDENRLAFIAEHIGMGEASRLHGVHPDALRAFFKRLSYGYQLHIVSELEQCEPEW